FAYTKEQVCEVKMRLYEAEKLYEAYCGVPIGDRGRFAAEKYEEICRIWKRLQEYSHPVTGKKMKILQFNFAEVDDRSFGNYANCVENSFLWQLRKLNVLLMQGAQNEGIYLVDISYVQNLYGRQRFHDEKLYYIAKMPFSTEALPAIAREVISIIKAVMARFKKCVILDLDQTLWGGVIGDDGLEGIQIGELGIGHAFQEFQLWLKELTKRGIILAVCSKNDEEKAKEPFLKHPEMVLRLEDIAVFIANWEDKAGNIREIAKILNLGMDSFVFIDDNPFERNLVRSMLPEVTVPELPEDPALYLSYLKEQNLFETISYSEADQDRTRQYREEAGRTSLKQQFATYEEYLEQLGMVAEAKPFDAFHIPRIAQLSQRSNQFNLRTVRYTEEEAAGLAEDDRYITLYFTLKDKFGDHGLISLVVMKKEEDTLFIENWLMSCRVLKRTMETFVVNTMLEEAKKADAVRVVGEYIKTPKNAMVEHLYEEMGFHPLGEGKYEIITAAYQKQKTWIERAE
ncbi:MAG: HAD-IIIC family phosphatase, partial [Lachnospiraceae bacterium]|nr:HAD-IIIC family phosphatase [Lachnospiraceae bacterium]